jgi:hypothetical protein
VHIPIVRKFETLKTCVAIDSIELAHTIAIHCAKIHTVDMHAASERKTLNFSSTPKLMSLWMRFLPCTPALTFTEFSI